MTIHSRAGNEDRIAPEQRAHPAVAGALQNTDPNEPTPMVLTIDTIKAYDRNPRRERNEAYDLIRQSIRQRGFRGSLPITRRSGDSVYMVAEGGNTVLQILKELYAETQDTRYYEIHCLFEPWISESETLISHLGENDNRGPLLFIDRARAIRELRNLLEAEQARALSSREFVTYLRERGYVLDQATLIKMNYAVETLYPVVPAAFRCGLGKVHVEHLRKLEGILVAFLENRKRDAATIAEARQWWLVCLARYDGERFDLMLDQIQRELEGYVAELCEESNAKVRADFALIAATGQPGADALPAVPLKFKEEKPPERCEPPNLRLLNTPGNSASSSWQGDPEAHGDEGYGFAEESDDDELSPDQSTPEEPVRIPNQQVRSRELPQDLKSLRARMWTLSMQVAQHHGLGACIHPCPAGGGFIVDLPEERLFDGDEPESTAEAQRVTLWWMLAALSEEWPYGIGQTPSLAYLEAARIYPAILAAAEDDRSTLTDTLMPWVSFPPSLDIAVRQLFATLDDRDYGRLLQLIDTRRALQAHCRRLGKRTVWDL